MLRYKLLPPTPDPRVAYRLLDMMEISDTVRLCQRERARIRRLNPQGLHKRELPPPIPFCTIFNDRAYEIAELVKTAQNTITIINHRLSPLIDVTET